MTTWTDDDLDAALTDLGALLDDPSATEGLVAVRARLDPDTADVVEIGRTASPRRPGRLVPAVLVAAAVVAAVVLAAVLWPRAADRSVPPASPSAPADVVAARQALLPDPVIGGSSVLLDLAGVGDATVSLPSFDSTVRSIAVGFVCGDPRFDGDPNGPDNAVSEYKLTDNLGTVEGGYCQPLGEDVAFGGFGVGHTVATAGRANVRVDVPAQDTVWRLAVMVR